MLANLKRYGPIVSGLWRNTNMIDVIEVKDSIENTIAVFPEIFLYYGIPFLKNTQLA